MRFLALAGLAAISLAPASVFAQPEPAENVLASRHQYLAKAQVLARQTFDQLTAAQKYNKYDMKGHAEKAKELLDQVSKEIRLATDAANAADAQHHSK